jgi:hypothetical protein
MCVSECKMIKACLLGSKAKYTNLYNTSVSAPPFSFLVNMGFLNTGSEILLGTYDLLHIPDKTKNFLISLQHPFEIMSNSIPMSISCNDHVNFLCFIKERTSSGISGIHYGTWKCNLEIPYMTSIDTTLCETPLATGYAFNRWKKMLDILLMKEFSNYSFNKIRTIGLVEADYQLNNKLIGKKIKQRSHSLRS